MKYLSIAFLIVMVQACGTYEPQAPTMRQAKASSMDAAPEDHSRHEKEESGVSGNGPVMESGDLALLRTWKKGEYQGNEQFQISLQARVLLP